MKLNTTLTIFLIIFLNHILKAEEINIECNFGFETFGFLGNLSCCNVVENLKINTENVILNITNALEKRRVQAFSAKNKEIYYLPQGIGKSFIYLEVLEVFNSSLKKITSENLKEFGNLKYLSLSNNKIEYLESNLFQHNFKINTVNLNYNRISLIEPTFLKTKTDLTIFTLEGNVCYSGTAENKTELDNMIEVIKISCLSVVQNINSNLQENHKKIETCANEQLNLNELIKVLTNKSENRKKKMADYEKEIGDMKEKIDVNLKSINNLRSSLNNVTNRSNTFINKINAEIESLKTCPSSIANLNKIVAEVNQNCTLIVQILENKYTGILNKTINMENDISISRFNVFSNTDNIKQHETKLLIIEAKSNNVSIDLNKIWNEINRINGKIDEQKTELTNTVNKTNKDFQNRFAQNLTNLTNKVVSIDNHFTKNINSLVKNITKLMNIKINDTETRFNKKLQMLLNSTDLIISVNIAESRKDIEALAKSYKQAIEKFANCATQIKNLNKKDEETQKRLLEIEESNNVDEIMNMKSNELNQSLHSSVRTELDDFREKLQNNKNNFDLLALNLNQTLESVTSNLSEKFELLLRNNITTMEQMHQNSKKEMLDYVKILIISNIILIVLLVLTFSCLIYSLKFKNNSTNTKQIQRENSNCQQFNTISTHVQHYDQEIEPVYATTDFNEEPIYEAYADPSLYTTGDPQHYEATNNVQYIQEHINLYEAANDLIIQEQNHQSYECDGLYEASIYEMTGDDQHYNADTSQNDIENAAVYESGDDSIYEVAEHAGTMNNESMTSIDVSDEDLYAEIPVKINDEQEKVDESEIYAVLRKN